MTHTYNLTGLTCNGCVAKAKSALLMLGDVTEATVQLTAPQATVTMQRHIPVEALQNALKKAGDYTITEAHEERPYANTTEEKKSWAETYKPLLLLFGFLLLVSALVATTAGGVDWMEGMRVFMGGFFLSFSFFKLLDLKGFADSYASYDVVAKRVREWGFLYAFVELLLGVAYVANVQPVLTNLVTLAVMSVSVVGVLQSVLAKRKIQCACLGAVFNLPMSTVTVVEDALMIGMSAVMLWNLL